MDMAVYVGFATTVTSMDMTVYIGFVGVYKAVVTAYFGISLL